MFKLHLVWPPADLAVGLIVNVTWMSLWDTVFTS